MLKLIAILIARVLFQPKIFGKENVPKRGGFILVSNHLSYIDPIILGAFSPRRLNFMAKKELFCNGIASFFLFALGAFPVKRDSADIFALKEAMRRVKEGGALLVFPQGSRLGDKAQPGVGFLAAKLDVPVVPVFIKGTDIAMPKGKKTIKRTEITVRFGKQIPIERRMPYQDIAEAIMANIRHLSC